MDRDRLKEVHQTDLTESRINEDFVDWLKTKGPTWLLMILIGVGGYLGIVRWRQYKQQHFVEAWVALSECRLPGAFEDVADDAVGFCITFGSQAGTIKQLVATENVVLGNIRRGVF